MMLSCIFPPTHGKCRKIPVTLCTGKAFQWEFPVLNHVTVGSPIIVCGNSLYDVTVNEEPMTTALSVMFGLSKGGVAYFSELCAPPSEPDHVI